MGNRSILYYLTNGFFASFYFQEIIFPIWESLIKWLLYSLNRNMPHSINHISHQDWGHPLFVLRTFLGECELWSWGYLAVGFVPLIH